jgi:hypothetical protein
VEDGAGGEAEGEAEGEGLAEMSHTPACRMPLPCDARGYISLDWALASSHHILPTSSITGSLSSLKLGKDAP